MFKMYERLSLNECAVFQILYNSLIYQDLAFSFTKIKLLKNESKVLL